MISIKSFDVKHLGEILVLGIVLLVVITIFMTVINPLLTTVLPTVFTHGLTLTDTILLFVLMKLYTK